MEGYQKRTHANWDWIQDGWPWPCWLVSSCSPDNIPYRSIQQIIFPLYKSSFYLISIQSNQVLISPLIIYVYMDICMYIYMHTSLFFCIRVCLIVCIFPIFYFYFYFYAYYICLPSFDGIFNNISMRNEVQNEQMLKEPLNPIEDQRMSIKGDWLDYQAQPNIQGQCLLTSVVPVRKSKLRLTIFVFVCFIFVGIPYLLTFWYPKLKKKWYYIQVPLQEATHFYVMNNDGQPTYPIKYEGPHSFTQDTSKDVIFFYNRYLKYVIEDKTVRAACIDFFPRFKKVQQEGTRGLSLQQAKRLRRSYGVGTMILEQKDVIDLFVEQIMRPLYIFIVLSCLLWVYEQYFYYSIMIFVTAAFGIGTSLIQTYRINKKIYEMAYFETQVNILRDGQIKKGSSKYVVPGDIVFIKNPMKIPFDGLLLHGSALSNECSITGQSVPVLKKAEYLQNSNQIKNSYIFEGSFMIQINAKQKFKANLSIFQQFREEYGLPVYVLRTNFITMKGQLIRIISFPVERKNIFEKQSVKFLLFLFVLTVISYIFLVIKLAEHADPIDLFVKFLDLVTVTVPPGLPVSMTFGIIFALEKMKEKSIFCTSPNKTIVGGMTNLLCFDKTGTLTEDFMDFNALIPCLTGKQLYEQSEPKFTSPIKKQSDNKIQQILKNHEHIGFALNNMAVNHTIVRLESTGENVGDPMEVKMFEFGQFEIKNTAIENQDILQEYQSSRGHHGEIYRRFQFDSELFRMSTIAKSNTTGEDFFIYCKGSPEHMHKIFDASTVPKNYHKILKKNTCMGFRVLAIGHRLIKGQQIKLSRLELESNLKFDGFEIFENRLKPQTTAALGQLTQANLPFVMITGDNPLTASSISYECKIFDPSKKAYICHWQTDHFLLEKFHEHQLQQFEEDEQRKFSSIKQILKFVEQNNLQLCLTGKGFNHLFENHFDNNRQQCKQLLSYIKVFARAKPNDKARIISTYQSLGKTVGMCGDGANDCGALKQADIGLSLSQAEASISAPFTSQITNISSMIELLKQCRAGLATNYSLFNIMAIYSLVQYNTVVIVQFFYGFPGDFHYLYWDTCCNFVFFLTFGYTGTSKKLTKQSPNCSLFTISNISQLMIAFFIQFAGQFIMIWLLNIYGEQIGYDSDITYRQFVAEDNDQQFITDSFENNILFMFTNFIYVFTLLGFSISRPWRKQFFTNLPFTVLLVLVLGLSSVLVLFPEARPEFMELDRIQDESLLKLVLVISWATGVFIFVLQKYILEPFFNKIKLKNLNSLYI